ncbi:MAG TPA: methyltransferase [Candidatus Hydrogenedentes bacterium]|nr:methyltransferase [Candidatus Hydrogenedentota bacterium]HNT87248.1 methyltransferase [Candidatus Hydrogenedentota bacterium]
MSELHEFTGKISEMANAFRQSRILFAAHDHNVFAFLEEDRGADDVAQRIGCSVRGTTMLLDGLVALDLVTKHGGRYRNGPVATTCLVPGKPAYQGAILRHTQRSWDAWSRLSEAVRTGTGVKQGSHRPATGELRDFILGMSNIAFLSAPDLLEHIDIAPFKHLLDVGGGPGTYTITFLKANPRLRATIMDLPPVIEIARDQVAVAGLEERVAYRPGDCTADDLGSGYDLILVSNIVHILSADQNARLVRKCHDALESGGTLIIKDFLTDPDRSGPAFSLIFALHMLLHTEAGGTYSIEEVRRWTDDAGFLPGELKSLTPKTRLWAAQKG